MKPLPSFDKARVLVVGDVMLDRYWFGDVDRISPEAPVPVLKVSSIEERPGGAANVARNVAALGAQCTLLSVVGDDEPGRTLEQMLVNEHNVKAMMHRDSSIATTVKLRAIARHQQLLRMDFETQPSHEVLRAKLADYWDHLQEADVVVLSDYGKGGLTHIAEMIRLARKAGKRVLVDPKGDDYARYKGASLLTPNRSEFRAVAGSWGDENELAEKAEKLRVELKLEALLVTRSEDGMSLYSGDGRPFHVAAQAREVFDVSGAGDTVIATLAAMLASEADLPHSVICANLAGSIVVGKLGTAVVTRDEIVHAMNGRPAVKGQE